MSEVLIDAVVENAVDRAEEIIDNFADENMDSTWSRYILGKYYRQPPG